MIQKVQLYSLLLILLYFTGCSSSQTSTPRERVDFTQNWSFHLGDIENGQSPDLNDTAWRELDLPHDWSIEGSFDQSNRAGVGGGALPGGIGWYRKSFVVPESDSGKIFHIDFDGVYLNSEVWINGYYLGKRPYGYSSFRYNITPYLHYGDKQNVVAVKVDNSKQPNSRWYSGSGIYRNVWLVKTNPIHVDHWGTYLTTPVVADDSAQIVLNTTVKRSGEEEAKEVAIQTFIYDSKGNKVAEATSESFQLQDTINTFRQELKVSKPRLWSVEDPYLYKIVTLIKQGDKVVDNYATPLGIRYYNFDAVKGFFLNGKHLKIRGVCNHHDLGALGAAINVRALERQLEILKGMGVNGIRTSHNPPAPELLQLCDSMGFIVMDEAFDMWRKQKNPFDYHLNWDQWHKQDLQDMIKRDRNHPSIFIWSIGNEIPEQWDSTGITIAKELAGIVRDLDTTRMITAALNDPEPHNNIYKSRVLDLVGFNYHHQNYEEFPQKFPGQKFIATETTSALATRGHYDMPSDSIRRWPIRWDKPFTEGNPDHTVSAYDNVSAPWGSTHEETWKIIKRHDYLSGMYIWTGFDYIGEPTPYEWPSRSSYFGVVDLAGFPKDAYYMYKSEWTDDTVLHIFPHWNWNQGDSIDVWAYYNNADEVELFLNGVSMGTKRKQGDDLHVMWRLAYQPGELKAVSRSGWKEVMTKTIETAGAPAVIKLEADRHTIKADGKDLSYVTVKVLDKDGNLVPDADNLMQFKIEGDAVIAGVDNGDPTSVESFKADHRKAFNGLALVIIQAKEKAGKVILTATSEGLKSDEITINLK